MAGEKPVLDVINYIHGEMTTNLAGSSASQLRGWIGISAWNIIAPATQAVDMARAYKLWYDLVKPGGNWDHKSRILARFGRWTRDDVGRKLYQFDIWSNVHYGYLGLAVGFSKWDLLSGAGVAQVMARTVPDGYWERRVEEIGDADFLSALDDPADQAAIKLGFELWEKHRASVTPTNILTAARAKAGRLSTRPG